MYKRQERGLAKLLRRLPGKKVLLTNAPRRYSHEVIRHLGLHRHLASHIPIESMTVHGRLRPKPSRALLRKLIAAEGVPARRCILVEDTVDNLRSAKALGMRTAWITQYLPRRQEQLRRPRLSHAGRAGYIDVKVKSVRQLPASLRRLTRA